MSNFDYKKEYKDLYMPSTAPHLITIPAMRFIMVRGTGNPNDEDGAYAKALTLLYALSYTIKMSKKSGVDMDGYFPYVVPPLEGLWWSEDETFDITNVMTQKDKFSWYAMIRQPEFVNEEVFAWACEQVQRKKGLPVEQAQLQVFEEGDCVQILHKGSYDDEPASFHRMDEFVKEQGLSYTVRSMPNERTFGVHHEIYLGDPRKSKPENLKTVLRKQVTK